MSKASSWGVPVRPARILGRAYPSTGVTGMLEACLIKDGLGDRVRDDRRGSFGRDISDGAPDRGFVAVPFVGVGSPARAGWFSGMGMMGNAWSNTPTLSLASEISATGKPVPTVEATPRIRSRSA